MPVDQTRRHFLTVAAGAAVATAAPATAAPAEPDPIYAAIERHKAAGVPWDAAIDVRSEFPESADPMTDEQWEQRDLLDEAVDDARVILEQAGLDPHQHRTDHACWRRHGDRVHAKADAR